MDRSRRDACPTARRALLYVLLGLGPFLLGCDTTATQPESEVVVEAYLQAGQSLPAVRLTRTAATGERYDPQENAVRGAEVVVDSLGETDTTTVAYTEVQGIPGRYVPTTTLEVVPQATYRLRAITADGTTLRSTTTVPGPITLVDTMNTTAVYQGPTQPSFSVRLPDARPSERQTVFTFTTTALLDFDNTPDSILSRRLTPFYADSYTPGTDSLERFRITSSGLLNEGNFERTNGTITIDLPWIAVAFFGANQTAVNVVDDNYFDFLRSQQVQQQGFAPGEIPNVIEHIEGGTGLFGSYARVAAEIQVQCSEEVPAVDRCPDP